MNYRSLLPLNLATLRTLRPLLFIAGLLMPVIALQSCNESGSVGSGLPSPESDVVVDSFMVNNLSVERQNPFAGNFGFVSSGQFQDPLFGDISATAYIKPILSNNPDTTFEFGSNNVLQLSLNEDGLYGDSLASGTYELREINEIFRGRAFRLNQELALTNGPPIGTFTIEDQDSIEVDLRDEWAQRYGEIYTSTAANRDSLYVRNFLGLAVVPQGTNKIIALDNTNTRFRFIEPDPQQADSSSIANRDTISVGILQNAYGLERTNADTADDATLFAYSTFEKVFTFDFNFAFDNVDTRNISRAELVLYRDNTALQQSLAQAGPNAVRPDDAAMRLFIVQGDEVLETLGSSSAVAAGQYRSEDEAYHFDITQPLIGRAFVNLPDDARFYIVYGQTNGIVRSTAIFNEQAAPAQRPKVIITSVQTTN